MEKHNWLSKFWPVEVKEKCGYGIFRRSRHSYLRYILPHCNSRIILKELDEGVPQEQSVVIKRWPKENGICTS